MRAPRAPATTSARAPRETRAKGATDSRSSTSERPERLERDVVEPRSERLARGAGVQSASPRGLGVQKDLQLTAGDIADAGNLAGLESFHGHPRLFGVHVPLAGLD